MCVFKISDVQTQLPTCSGTELACNKILKVRNSTPQPNI